MDVIGRHVVLKKAGANYKGLCPFHNEKTPSFMVSEAKQIFTCFGCGARGDVIEFVQRQQNLDFRGAIEKLAEEYGIDLKDSSFAQEGRRSAFYEANRTAAAFFYRNFFRQSNRGWDYMRKRGIEPEILRKFGVGYADESWDSLCRHMTEKEVPMDVLEALGLAARSGERCYDKFRERVMFPIINTRGKVIGFGGRALGDGNPKYLNSPESTVFQKKNNLYGLNLTRQDISREDRAILVEGYMDVISLYQHGVRNVSASLGTALTESQAAMLKRYTRNVVLAYDADEAGQAAALRGMDILYGAGCKVKVLVLDREKDPDEYIKKYGRDAFQELVEKALPFAEYKLYRLRKTVDLNTTEGSVTFLQEAAKLLRGLSPVEAEAYIKKIAAETRISEGALRLETFGRYGEGEAPAAVRRKESGGSGSGGARAPADMLEKNLIRLTLMKSSYVPMVRPYQEAFRNPECFQIYRAIESVYSEEQEIDIKKVADGLDEEGNRMLSDILENVNLADRDEEVFRDCVAHIENEAMKKREEELIQLLSVVEESDPDKAGELMRELMEIQKQRKGGTLRDDI